MSTNNLLGRKQEIAFSILAKALTARGVKVSIAGELLYGWKANCYRCWRMGCNGFLTST